MINLYVICKDNGCYEVSLINGQYPTICNFNNIGYFIKGKILCLGYIKPILKEKEIKYDFGYIDFSSSFSYVSEKQKGNYITKFVENEKGYTVNYYSLLNVDENKATIDIPGKYNINKIKF